MTFDEALAELGLVDPEAARRGAVDAVAREAVERLRERSPVDTGAFRDGWSGDETRIENDVPYASEVHDGLALELVAEVLAELDPEFELEVARRLGLDVGP